MAVRDEHDIAALDAVGRDGEVGFPNQGSMRMRVPAWLSMSMHECPDQVKRNPSSVGHRPPPEAALRSERAHRSHCAGSEAPDASTRSLCSRHEGAAAHDRAGRHQRLDHGRRSARARPSPSTRPRRRSAGSPSSWPTKAGRSASSSAPIGIGTTSVTTPRSSSPPAPRWPSIVPTVADSRSPKPQSAPFPIPPSFPALDLAEGSRIRFGDIDLLVLHTPGHTEGSVSLLSEEDRVIFTGDTLFAGGWGRVDLPGASQEQMIESLTRLSTLDDELTVLRRPRSPDDHRPREALALDGRGAPPPALVMVRRRPDASQSRRSDPLAGHRLVPLRRGADDLEAVTLVQRQGLVGVLRVHAQLGRGHAAIAQGRERSPQER